MTLTGIGVILIEITHLLVMRMAQDITDPMVEFEPDGEGYDLSGGTRYGPCSDDMNRDSGDSFSSLSGH